MKPYNRIFAGAIALAIAATPALASDQNDDNWLDQPRTPGDWVYSQTVSQSRAQYLGAGGDVFALQCDFSSRQMRLDHPVAAAKAGMMRIRTETGDRVFNAAPLAATSTNSVTLSARDPLLDAMAITKGRFAVEMEGAPTLYLPSWAEITRVIEDCR